MSAIPRKTVSVQVRRDSKSQCDSKFTKRSNLLRVRGPLGESLLIFWGFGGYSGFHCMAYFGGTLFANTGGGGTVVRIIFNFPLRAQAHTKLKLCFATRICRPGHATISGFATPFQSLWAIFRWELNGARLPSGAHRKLQAGFCSSFLYFAVFAFVARTSESGKVGWKTQGGGGGRGKHSVKHLLPKNVFWTPTPTMGFPPPFWRLSVISLKKAISETSKSGFGELALQYAPHPKFT